MQILNYGIDRLRISFSNYKLKDFDSFTECFPQKGSSRGWLWYKNHIASIGFSNDGIYCSVEFFALFFITKGQRFNKTEAIVKEFLDSFFSAYSAYKVTRLDIFIDKKKNTLEPLTHDIYTGTSKLEHYIYGEEGNIGTYYLQPKTKAWILKRYDKSEEIIAHNISHRYNEHYNSNVIRTEYSYQKKCLKNLKEQSFANVIAYAIRNMGKLKIVESEKLIELLTKEVQQVCNTYKSSKGQYTGEKVKRQILENARQLHAEYNSMSNDKHEFISRLLDI